MGLDDQGWPDIDWIKIPSGEVTLEGSGRTFPVKPFHLARYTVTNAQFQCFLVNPEGYTNSPRWVELDAQPGTPEMPSWDQSNHTRETVAVGIYMQGDSIQGVSNLSGNVWEWCLNAYQEPANTQSFGPFRRVVRGGSWIGDQDLVRASFRFKDPPACRNISLGFRVGCVSPKSVLQTFMFPMLA